MSKKELNRLEEINKVHGKHQLPLSLSSVGNMMIGTQEAGHQFRPRQLLQAEVLKTCGSKSEDPIALFSASSTQTATTQMVKPPTVVQATYRLLTL